MHCITVVSNLVLTLLSTTIITSMYIYNFHTFLELFIIIIRLVECKCRILSIHNKSCFFAEYYFIWCIFGHCMSSSIVCEYNWCEKFIPIIAFSVLEFSNLQDKCRVKFFYHPVCLRMICG